MTIASSPLPFQIKSISDGEMPQCKILKRGWSDTGGSHVQFSMNPETGRMIVIEMNPRVSRSSALAS